MAQPESRSAHRTFRAAHISTPLQDALAVALNADPVEAGHALRQHRFDQAPVVHRNHVVGWITTAELQGAEDVPSVLRPLSDSAILSSEASISTVLDFLSIEGFIFTVSESGLAGFITSSDLDRHAARSHFYLLVADAEMALADIVRRVVSQERVVASIRGPVLKTWNAALAAHQEADAVEYLFIQELAALFLGSSVGENAPAEMKAALADLCLFRRFVMHPTKRMTADHDAAALAHLSSQGDLLIPWLDDVVAMATGHSRWK